MSEPFPCVKQLAAATARAALGHFLRTGCRLDCTPREPPRVSTIILAYNRAELTLRCIQSLAGGLNRTPMEIVLVDNGSRDETPEIAAHFQGVQVHTNASNQGFPVGVNQGAALASGDYLLLLNNDTEVFGRSVDAAVDLLDHDPTIGAIGGKIVLLDGSLQEAGCMFWRDGNVRQYARGSAPDDPACGFMRDVAYCSGAFLMTRRSLFRELGGLDPAFSPGYFEDCDYCVRCWEAGWRVVFHPDVMILHHESATAAKSIDLHGVFARNARYFAAKHAGWLSYQPPYEGSSPLIGRTAYDDSAKVLLVASATKLPGNFEQVRHWVHVLQALGCSVTLALLSTRPSPMDAGLGIATALVEVLSLTTDQLGPLLDARPLYYDLILCAVPGFLPLITGHRSGKTRIAATVGNTFALVA